MKALKALENGTGKQEDIDHLQELTRKLWIGKTFCAHAPGAMEPLMGALKHFRGEFEAKVVNAAAQTSTVEQA